MKFCQMEKTMLFGNSPSDEFQFSDLFVLSPKLQAPLHPQRRFVMSTDIHFDDLCHRQNPISHAKPHVIPGKGQSVLPCRVFLVGGPGVLGQHIVERLALVLRDLGQQVIGKYDAQRFPGYCVGEAAGGIGAAVGVGQIGLDAPETMSTVPFPARCSTPSNFTEDSPMGLGR